MGFRVLLGTGTLDWALPLSSALVPPTLHPRMAKFHLWKETAGNGIGSVNCRVTRNVATCTQSVTHDCSGTKPREPDVMSTKMTGLGEYVAFVTIKAGLEKRVKEIGIVSPGTSISAGGIARNTQQAVLAGVAALAGGFEGVPCGEGAKR